LGGEKMTTVYQIMEVTNLFKDETYIPIEDAETIGLLKNRIASPYQYTIQKEANELLSDEAYNVLKTLLDSPQELEKLITKGTGHKKLTLRKIKKFFRSKGLSFNKIKLILAELHMYLLYLES
jgi:hypothetical protein